MAGSPTLSRADLQRLHAAGIRDANDARKLVRVLRRLIHSTANQTALSEFIEDSNRQPKAAKPAVAEQRVSTHPPTSLPPNEITPQRSGRSRFRKIDHNGIKERLS